MDTSRIAAQLYTVREHLQDEGAFAASMRRVAAIGYRAVQISGAGPIAAQAMRRMCDDEGLTICATHEPGKEICESPQQVVDRLGTLGCRYTAYPFPHVPITSMASVEALARQLDDAGAVLRRAGQVLCYHNHHMELARIHGRTVLQWLFDLTAPANLQAEPDTYWLQYGGADPAAWCQRLAGRLPLLHLKDYGIGERDGKPQVQMREIGNGNLEWHHILTEAGKAGCEWFIVEQDVCPGDPFDSLAQSLEYLRMLHV